MYTPHDPFDAMPALAGGIGVAVLKPPSLSREPLIGRFERLRLSWRHRLAAIDWAPDLAEDIGSRRWFRGLATLAGLVMVTLITTPDVSAIQAVPAMVLDSEARDEFRSQMITPLGLGADSGHRMGPSTRVVPLAEAPTERPILQVAATFGQGDSFNAMLLRAGVTPYDAARASELVTKVMPQGQIAPGTPVDITLGARDPVSGERSLDRLAMRARFDLALAVHRQGGTLQITTRPIAVDTTPLRIRGLIGPGIYRSARAAGAPIEAIQQYLQAIDKHLALDTDVAPTDTFDIIVAYRRSANGEVRVGDLLYAGIDRGDKPRAQLLRWGEDGQFFEASGMGAQRTGLIMPVVGRVTSGYGARRHPVLGYTRMHAGVDFGAAWGTPIYAVGDATVNYAGWHGGHGNYVKLDHGGGWATGYAHMSRIAVSPGSRVRGGQVIGYVGSTGLSTGPHLHYELYRNGSTVNPLSVSFTVSNQVDAKELAAFRARLAALKAVKPGAALGGNGLAPARATIAAAPGREIDKIS